MSNSQKTYYNLKELSQLDNLKYLKYRQSQKRVKIVSERYGVDNKLIYKKSNEWYIHTSLLNEFTKEKKLIDYKLFITIASKNQLPLYYWKIIVFQLKKELKKIDASTRVKYVIETTNNNINHLHFITSFCDIQKLKSIITNHPLTNNSNEMNTKILKITDVEGIHKYLRKQNIPVLLK